MKTNWTKSNSYVSSWILSWQPNNAIVELKEKAICIKSNNKKSESQGCQNYINESFQRNYCSIRSRFLSWLSSKSISGLRDNFLSMLQPTGLHESNSTQFLLKNIGLLNVFVASNYRKLLSYQQQKSAVKSKVYGVTGDEEARNRYNLKDWHYSPL